VSSRAATAMPPDPNTGTATSETPALNSHRDTATRVSLMLARAWRSRSGSVDGVRGIAFQAAAFQDAPSRELGTSRWAVETGRQVNRAISVSECSLPS